MQILASAVILAVALSLIVGVITDNNEVILWAIKFILCLLIAAGAVGAVGLITGAI